MKTILALWQREIVRFYRQRSRVVGAIGSPILFWLLIGCGIGTSFRYEAETDVASYATFFYPGVLLLILMFTAIFSSISIIEDRKEGFLQAVLVSPAARFQIVLGKILGGMTLAILQSLILLAISPFLGFTITLSTYFLILGILVLNAFVLTALGFVLAWQFQSIQGFHAVMNMLLMPMWILSGALFPAEGAASWVQWLMRVNPLSYGMKALHVGFFPSATYATYETLNTSMLITLLFGVGLLLLSISMASKRTVKNIV